MVIYNDLLFLMIVWVLCSIWYQCSLSCCCIELSQSLAVPGPHSREPHSPLWPLAPLTLLALAPLSPRCNHWSWDCLYLPLDWDWEYPGDRAHLTHSGTPALPELRVWYKVGLSGWMCWVGWSPRFFRPPGPLHPRKVTNDFPSIWDTELRAKGSCSPESDTH